MKRFLAPLLLLTLAACSQSPTPDTHNGVDLAPMTFGSAGYDAAQSLAKHSSGVYVAGLTMGNLHGTHQGAGDAFIRKYSSGGAVLWGKQFGTPEFELGMDVASDSNNNAYVVGTTSGSLAGSRGGYDVFLRKYTSGSSVAWTQQFGSSDDDYAESVVAYGSNAIYVVGRTYGNLSGTSKGDGDAFIRKYTASGSIAWTRQFGTSSFDAAFDVAVDSSGNAYVVGTTFGSLGGANGGRSDMFIRKYSPSGSVLWTRQEHLLGESAKAVAVAGSNVYMVGEYAGIELPRDVWLLKYNTSGTFLWDMVYGPNRDVTVWDATADSTGVVFSGWTTSNVGGGAPQGGSDGYVIKVDANGERFFRWSKQQGTRQTDVTTAVVLRGSELYIAGQTGGTLGSGNRGSDDAFIRRMNAADGSTVWTDQ